MSDVQCFPCAFLLPHPLQVYNVDVMPDSDKSVSIVQRRTRPRQAVTNAFREAARPLTPEEACALAQRKHRALGIATVYRTIKHLTGAGLLIPVRVPGHPTRYEWVRQDHHHHFHCQSCNKVYPIAGCPRGIQALTPRGFTVKHHEVTLYGLCPACGLKRKSKRN